MKVRGREIKFLKSVQAICDLTEICPDKDINRIAEIFSGSLDETQKNCATLIHTLNKCYEMSRYFDEKSKGNDYEPQYLSVEEILYLTQEEYQALLEEAMKAMNEDKTTVKAEKTKKKKEIAEAESN